MSENDNLPAVPEESKYMIPDMLRELDEAMINASVEGLRQHGLELIRDLVMDKWAKVIMDSKQDECSIGCLVGIVKTDDNFVARYLGPMDVVLILLLDLNDLMPEGAREFRLLEMKPGLNVVAEAEQALRNKVAIMKSATKENPVSHNDLVRDLSAVALVLRNARLAMQGRTETITG